MRGFVLAQAFFWGGGIEKLISNEFRQKRNLLAPKAEKPISGMAELRFKIAYTEQFPWRESTLSIISVLE